MPHLSRRTSGRTRVRLCLKARDSRVFSCQQTVDCHTAFMLLAFVRTYYGFTAQLFKEGEAHIGKCRFSVHTCFLLHYGNKVVESVVLFLGNGDFSLSVHRPQPASLWRISQEALPPLYPAQAVLQLNVYSGEQRQPGRADRHCRYRNPYGRVFRRISQYVSHGR